VFFFGGMGILPGSWASLPAEVYAAAEDAADAA
jgi:hypothetical protein